MAKRKFTEIDRAFADDGNDDLLLKEEKPEKKLPLGVTLSNIRHLDIELLVPHPDNRTYFAEPKAEDYQRWKIDIKKRGIQNPLIVLPLADKFRLLAGETRWEIANDLKITQVPVRVISGQMTSKQQMEYLVKDNVFRRQMSGEKVKALCLKYIPNFENRIAEQKRGRNQSDGLVKEVMQVTGKSKPAAQKYVQRTKTKTIKAKSQPLDNIKASASTKLKSVYRLAEKEPKIVEYLLTELTRLSKQLKALVK